MDPKRLDLIIDRELRSALSVTPSADFTARIRKRVADQPRPVLFPWRWLALAGATPVAVAIALVLTRPALPEVRNLVPPAPPLVAAARPMPLPAQTSAPEAATPVTIPRAQTSVLPEVETIVPPGQAEVIQRFSQSLSDMSVSSRQLPRVVEVFEGELPQAPSYNEKRMSDETNNEIHDGKPAGRGGDSASAGQTRPGDGHAAETPGRDDAVRR